jgi:hypothetical protein
VKPKVYYRCPKGLVTVIQKSTGLLRCPPSKYPCALFILRPKANTRVQRLPDGRIEFMARFGEIRALLYAIDPEIAALLPLDLQDKPAWKEDWFAEWNRKRLQKRGKGKP